MLCLGVALGAWAQMVDKNIPFEFTLQFASIFLVIFGFLGRWKGKTVNLISFFGISKLQLLEGIDAEREGNTQIAMGAVASILRSTISRIKLLLA